MTASSWQVFQGETIALHYRELGEPEQPAVFLLHGWPDSPHTWDALAPQIAALGFRVITPFLRGFGPNRFNDDKHFRSGQLTAIANDICELANFLQLEKFAIVGHDWGAVITYVASDVAVAGDRADFGTISDTVCNDWKSSGRTTRMRLPARCAA